MNSIKLFHHQFFTILNGGVSIPVQNALYSATTVALEIRYLF